MNPQRIKTALNNHGELHLVVEEHEAVMAGSDEDYIGIRKGNTKFDMADNVIKIFDGTKEHCIDLDAVVYYHKPNDFPD
jgi:hypothetical protein